MARHKNKTWHLETPLGTDGAMLAALMDIRDELQTLVRILQCPNVAAGFQALPRIEQIARRIDKRLAKRVPLK